MTITIQIKQGDHEYTITSNAASTKELSEDIERACVAAGPKIGLGEHVEVGFSDGRFAYTSVGILRRFTEDVIEQLVEMNASEFKAYTDAYDKTAKSVDLQGEVVLRELTRQVGVSRNQLSEMIDRAFDRGSVQPDRIHLCKRVDVRHPELSPNVVVCYKDDAGKLVPLESYLARRGR